jgi:hypothetical protein
MPELHAVTKQFEAELHEGDPKLLRVPDRAPGAILQSHADPAKETNDFPDGWEELQSEDKLGCARGVLWSVAIEAAVVIAALVYWKIRPTF